MSIEYDVIVIGAGISGGIPAATYLQKAGAKVLLIDANDGPAYNCRSITHQGATCTPCAGGYAGGTAPMWGDLELEKYGAELIINPRAFGMLFEDDTSIFLGPLDPKGTYRDIAQHSEKDAKTFNLMLERIQETFMELADILYYQPPSKQNWDRILDRLAYVSDMEVEEFANMDAWEYLDHKFESDEIKQVLSMPFTASMVNADPDAKGEGAVGLLSPFYLVAGQIKGSNGLIVDVTLKIFDEYGGEMWLNSPVESIVVENGKAVGVKMEQGAEQHPGEVIKARHAVLSNAGALQTYKLLGDDVIRAADDALATKMKNWDNKSRPSTVNVWLLKDAPKWKAATKNQYVDHADWIYLALDSIKDWNAWKDAIINGDQEGGFQGWWEAFLPGLIDPTLRGDNGEYCFRVESVAPWDVLNEKGEIDPSKWEVYKKELADRRVEIFEKFAPGFKDLVIDNVHMKSPVNFEEDNRSLVYGCAQGGAFHSEQSYLTRMPYRMPIGNLFMCNSVYPANLTWAGSGYIAASMIAEDMGIRDQDWWVTKPGQWFMKNIQRVVPTGAGWKFKAALKFRAKATIGKAIGRIPTE